MINVIMLVLITSFYLFFIGRTVMLLFSGISPFVIGAGKKGMRRFVEAGFLAGLLIWTFEIVMHVFRVNLHILPGFFYTMIFEHTAVRITGLGLVSAGITLFFLSLVSFGNSWRVGVDTRNPGKLVTSGIFRFSRNPIFVSLDLIFLGTFLVFGNLFFLITLAIIVPGIHYQILTEEKFLAGKYGEEYAAYRQQVRRYL